MPDEHPYEELSAYVEGSASDDERRRVDEHLEVCDFCRADLEFAARARAALASLPDLEAPGLAEGALEWVRRGTGDERPAEVPDSVVTDGEAAVVPLSQRWSPSGRRRTAVGRRGRVQTWPRLAWGAGIAAAAAIAAVVVFAGLNGTSHNTAAKGAGGLSAEAGAPGRTLQPVRSDTNYDQSSLDSLAITLARQGGFKAATEVPAAAPSPAAEGAATTNESQDSFASGQSTEEAIACLQRGAGLAAGSSPTYLESAFFNGKPVYVGAFQTQPTGASSRQLQVVVVDQASCQFVYAVTQTL
jgi:hypothetical protein